MEGDDSGGGAEEEQRNRGAHLFMFIFTPQQSMPPPCFVCLFCSNLGSVLSFLRFSGFESCTWFGSHAKRSQQSRIALQNDFMLWHRLNAVIIRGKLKLNLRLQLAELCEPGLNVNSLEWVLRQPGSSLSKLGRITIIVSRRAASTTS